jgi:hypothetical protein
MAIHRMVMNPGEATMSYGCSLGEGVWLDFRRDHETGGRVEMSLKIEGASLEQIKRHWREIDAWRQLLLIWQGPSLLGGANGLFNSLDLEHRTQGGSYAELAKRLNNMVAKDLTAYLEDRRAFLQALDADMFHTHVDVIQWQQQTGHYGFGLVRAQSLLHDMGLKEADIRQWCANGLRNLRQGQPPFPLDEGPITRDYVIMRLRAWRRLSRPDVRGQVAFAVPLRRACGRPQAWSTWRLRRA